MFGHKKNKPPRTHIGPMRVHKTRNVMLLISIGFVGLYTLIDISLAYLNIKFSGLPQLNDTLTEKLFDYATWIVTSGATITVVKTIKGSTNSDSDEFEMMQNNTEDTSSVDEDDSDSENVNTGLDGSAPMESTTGMEEDASPSNDYTDSDDTEEDEDSSSSDSDLTEDETEEEPEEENEISDSSNSNDGTNTVFNVNNISKFLNNESLEKIIGGAGKMNGKEILQSIEELANKYINTDDKNNDNNNSSDDASIDDLEPDDESDDYTIDEDADNLNDDDLSDETVALDRDEKDGITDDSRSVSVSSSDMYADGSDNNDIHDDGVSDTEEVHDANSNDTSDIISSENVADSDELDPSDIDDSDASTDDLEPLDDDTDSDSDINTDDEIDDSDASIDDLEPLEESDIAISGDADQEDSDTEEASNDDESNELSDGTDEIKEKLSELFNEHGISNDTLNEIEEEFDDDEKSTYDDNDDVTADLDDGIDVTEEIDDNNREKLNQALNLRDVESMAPDTDMPDSDYFNITDDEIENFKNMVEANKQQSKSLPSYKKQKIGEILMTGNYVKSKNPERTNVYYNLDELSKFQIALLKFIGEI
jgi:hypothetical protein